MLKDVRVVALGEATHGSREFFQLKHRLLKFLVSELGFNVFAIDAGVAESRALKATSSRGRATRARGWWA